MPEGYITPHTTPKCSWNRDKDVSESPHHHVHRKYEARYPSCIVGCVLFCVLSLFYTSFYITKLKIVGTLLLINRFNPKIMYVHTMTLALRHISSQ